MVSGLNMPHGKMSDFVSFPMFGLALIFFEKKVIASDLNMSHGKISDFVSFPLFGFTILKVIKIL